MKRGSRRTSRCLGELGRGQRGGLPGTEGHGPGGERERHLQPGPSAEGDETSVAGGVSGRPLASDGPRAGSWPGERDLQ